MVVTKGLSNQKTQKIINDFCNRYVDKSIRIQWNSVKYSKTSKEHQDMVNEVCWWLYTNNIPFATEVVFKSGYNPDIICPTHVRPIIEIRHSERDKQTLEKFNRIPDDLADQIIYVDTNKEFEEKMIL